MHCDVTEIIEANTNTLHSNVTINAWKNSKYLKIILQQKPRNKKMNHTLSKTNIAPKNDGFQ